MSAQDFFAVVGRRRRRSSAHLPRSSQGRTCEKNQIFAVFQIQAIFPKIQDF